MQEVKPIDDKLRFGELNPDGSVKRNVFICAISGQPIEAGDVMIVVPNTNIFYRAKASLNWEQHKEQFAAAHDELANRAVAFSQQNSAPAPLPKVEKKVSVDNAG